MLSPSILVIFLLGLSFSFQGQRLVHLPNRNPWDPFRPPSSLAASVSTPTGLWVCRISDLHLASLSVVPTTEEGGRQCTWVSPGPPLQIWCPGRVRRVPNNLRPGRSTQFHNYRGRVGDKMIMARFDLGTGSGAAITLGCAMEGEGAAWAAAENGAFTNKT